MFKIKVREAAACLEKGERGLRITCVEHGTRKNVLYIQEDGDTCLELGGGKSYTYLEDDEFLDAEYVPLLLDKSCYWLIIMPVNEDEYGWKWRGSVWRKGDDAEFTHVFKKTIEEIEAEAERWMKCEGNDGRRTPSQNA